MDVVTMDGVVAVIDSLNALDEDSMFALGAADFFKPMQPRYPNSQSYMDGWADSEGYVCYMREMERDAMERPWGTGNPIYGP